MGVAELVGLGLSLAGTAAGMTAARSSRNAMNNQVKAQLKQQEAFQQQASPFYEQSLRNASRDKALEDIATGATQAQGQYEASAKVPGATNPLPTGVESGAVIREARKNAAQGQGYDYQALQRWLTNQDVNRNLGVISNLSNASAATAPTLTALAGNKGAALAGIGSLMSTAGNLASIYGGINARKPATGAYNVQPGGAKYTDQ